MEAAEKRQSFMPGTLVGERYRIVGELARGGFGVVYVAEQLATARPVALKLLTAHLYAMSVERLLAEARIASRVNSEHIVQVYDAGIDPDSSLVFVAMELLSGVTLAELIRSRGPLSDLETAEYLRQVAQGLDKVHGVIGSDGRAAPIVHRDLKPANLFLSRREDGTAWLKILDFGAAKMLADDGQVSSILRGTPEYMAYEQAAGGETTIATDIWAFGLIAFYLLTGRSYWRGAQSESGRAQVFGEVLSLPLLPPSERARELGSSVVLGPAFDEWFLRCVNREPSARHASAGDAARALARALDVTVRAVQAPALEARAPVATESASSKGSSLLTRDMTGVATSPRKSRAPLSPLAAALALLVLVNAAGAFFFWSRAQPPPGPPGVRDSGSNVAPPVQLPDKGAMSPIPVPSAVSSSLPGGHLPAPSASATARRPDLSLRGAAPLAPASASAGVSRAAKDDDVYDIR